MKIEEVLHDFPSYGYRRIAKHLKMNRKPVQRVMKFFGLRAFRRRGRKPKKNNNKSAVNYPNLLLQIMPSYPNHVWATDFTYLWFKDKFIYVCTVIDLFTRTVAGFSVPAVLGRTATRRDFILSSKLTSAIRTDFLHLEN